MKAIEELQKALIVPTVWIESLGVLSVWVDDEYENHDYDIVSPSDRRRLARAFQDLGYRTKGSREFQRDGISFVFPRPTSTLGANPADAARDLLGRDGRIPLLTPSQAMLIYLDAEAEPDPEFIKKWCKEQPTNLDKVEQWLERPERKKAFAQLKPALKAEQKKAKKRR